MKSPETNDNLKGIREEKKIGASKKGEGKDWHKENKIKRKGFIF